MEQKEEEKESQEKIVRQEKEVEARQSKYSVFPIVIANLAASRTIAHELDYLTNHPACFFRPGYVVNSSLIKSAHYDTLLQVKK